MLLHNFFRELCWKCMYALTTFSFESYASEPPVCFYTLFYESYAGNSRTLSKTHSRVMLAMSVRSHKLIRELLPQCLYALTTIPFESCAGNAYMLSLHFLLKVMSGNLYVFTKTPFKSYAGEPVCFHSN